MFSSTAKKAEEISWRETTIPDGPARQKKKYKEFLEVEKMRLEQKQKDESFAAFCERELERERKRFVFFPFVEITTSPCIYQSLIMIN